MLALVSGSTCKSLSCPTSCNLNEIQASLSTILHSELSGRLAFSGSSCEECPAARFLASVPVIKYEVRFYHHFTCISWLKIRNHVANFDTFVCPLGRVLDSLKHICSDLFCCWFSGAEKFLGLFLSQLGGVLPWKAAVFTQVKFGLSSSPSLSAQASFCSSLNCTFCFSFCPPCSFSL